MMTEYDRRSRSLGLRLLAVAITTITIAACSQFGSTKDGVPKDLRVGISPNYPPLAYKDDGKLVGVEPDFADHLAKDLGVKVTLVETTFAELIPGLLANRYDVIMSGFSVTPAREQQVSFTQPYIVVGQMAVVRTADYDRLRDPKNMNQPATRVGVVAGTTGEAYARAELSKASIKSFPRVDDAVKALRLGQVDAFIHDAPAIWDVRGRPLFSDDQLKGIYTPLTKEPLAWAVRKDDTALLQRLDATLATWKTNGTIEHVLDHWMPVRKITLSPAGKK